MYCAILYGSALYNFMFLDFLGVDLALTGFNRKSEL